MSLTPNEIKKLVLPLFRKYRVRRAGLFGSAASGRMHRNSDIDLLVKVDNSFSLFDLIELKQALEKKLGKKVDLVEYSSIKSALKKEILGNEVRIYDAAG